MHRLTLSKSCCLFKPSDRPNACFHWTSYRAWRHVRVCCQMRHNERARCADLSSAPKLPRGVNDTHGLLNTSVNLSPSCPLGEITKLNFTQQKHSKQSACLCFKKKKNLVQTFQGVWKRAGMIWLRQIRANGLESILCEVWGCQKPLLI